MGVMLALDRPEPAPAPRLRSRLQVLARWVLRRGPDPLTGPAVPAVPAGDPLVPAGTGPAGQGTPCRACARTAQADAA